MARRYVFSVFPVWEGLRAIGRIDMKRAAGTLAVRAFWPGPGVAMGRDRQARLPSEPRRVATFTGLDRIDPAPGWLHHPK